MGKKKDDSNPTGPQELVIFGATQSQKTKRMKEKTLEFVDQENQIRLVNKLAPFGAQYLYSLLIVNQSSAPITEVKVRIKYPEFLNLNRSAPPTIINDPFDLKKGENQIRIEYEELSANDKKQIFLYLSPISLEEVGYLKAYVTFVNNKDLVNALESTPIDIQFDPYSIERKIIPSSEIRKFLQQSQIKKAVKSLGLMNNLPFDDSFYFILIDRVTQALNFQVISKDETNKTAWYLGTDLVSGDDILVISQIVANKIEWSAASQNPYVLVTLLTDLSIRLTEQLVLNGVITTINQISNLECKYCGNILPSFPQKGESLECDKCKYEQIVW